MKHELNTPLRPGAFFQKLNLKDVLKGMRKSELFEGVLVFLLSRICFDGYLISPFGLPFFAAVFQKKHHPIALLSALLGMWSLGYVSFSLKYSGALVILTAFLTLFQKELSGKTLLTALAVSLSLFLNGLVYVFTEGVFLYDTMLLLFECGVAFLSFFAMQKTATLLFSLQKRTRFHPTELVSLVLTFGAVVLSLALTENLLPLAHVFAITFLLALSVAGGVSISSPAGAVMGLSVSLASVYQPQTVCVYCLASFASGLFSRFGRVGVTLAFAVMSAFSTIFLCPEMSGIITVSYVALSGVVLLFLPDRIFRYLGLMERSLKEEIKLGARYRDAVENTLSETIDAVESVSGIFHEVTDSYFDESKNYEAKIFDETADSVCKQCSLCKFCWEKSREETVPLMNEMYDILEKKHTLLKGDAPQAFLDMCIRKDAFLAHLNKNYEAFKITRMWAGKVLQSKRLVAEQFESVSMILKNVKERLIEKMHAEPQLEQKIQTALDVRGVSAAKVSVLSGDGLSVRLDKVSCGENFECQHLVKSAVSEVLKVPVTQEKRECKSDICHLSYAQKTKFSYDVAVSFKPRAFSTESGDSVLSFPMENGKVALILSDGMGSGKEAHFQSHITTKLAKKMLCAGFEKETVVKMINNILMMDTDKDSFATIDLCILNLYTGTLEFVKTGAVNSYIKSENGVEEVVASSLPAGLVSEVSPDFSVHYLSKGNFVVLASDGVTDALESDEKSKISEILAGFKGTAKELSDRILDVAVKESGGLPADDLTVMVLSVLENA